jgi:hypothetical protein
MRDMSDVPLPTDDDSATERDPSDVGADPASADDGMAPLVANTGADDEAEGDGAPTG